MSVSSDESLLEQLLRSYEVQPAIVVQQEQGTAHSRASVRFSPYPSASAGPSTRTPGTGSAVLPGREVKRYPVARLSWFPTPETLSAARKGNLGHWTGRMEMMWEKRIKEINNGVGVPKNASGWADLSFGSMGKHLWRGVTTASAMITK